MQYIITSVLFPPIIFLISSFILTVIYFCLLFKLMRFLVCAFVPQFVFNFFIPGLAWAEMLPPF